MEEEDYKPQSINNSGEQGEVMEVEEDEYD